MAKEKGTFVKIDFEGKGVSFDKVKLVDIGRGNGLGFIRFDQPVKGTANLMHSGSSMITNAITAGVPVTLDLLRPNDHTRELKHREGCTTFNLTTVTKLRMVHALFHLDAIEGGHRLTYSECLFSETTGLMAVVITPV